MRTLPARGRSSPMIACTSVDLADAVAAEDRDGAALGHLEVDAVQDGAEPVARHQAGDLEQRHDTASSMKMSSTERAAEVDARDLLGRAHVGRRARSSAARRGAAR